MTIKNRRLLAILGSAAVLVVTAALVVALTGGAADKPAPDVTDNSGGTVTVGDITEDPATAPDTTPDTDGIKVSDIEDKPDTAPSTDVPDADPVLNIDGGEDVNVNISEFEDDKTPPAPPVVSDEDALTNPDTKPTYEDD